MDKITPHLWYDTEAAEAAELYTSILEGSAVTNVTTLRGTPGGDTEIVSFVLAGQPFMSISAGPLFSFNPSASFRVDCATSEEVDSLWNRLSEGGEALMPLDSYPFSERFGWLRDRFGLSWQIMHAGGREITQKIVPTLMFTGDVCGQAEDAVGFYISVFDASQAGEILRYAPGEEPDAAGTVKHMEFTLAGRRFAAMDSAGAHGFSFNEAISFMVYCDTQEEIDYFWERLSAVPEAEQCGWLKDRFGVSWQIVPRQMDEMLQTSDEDALGRVTEALLSMKKFDLAELEEAYAAR